MTQLNRNARQLLFVRYRFRPPNMLNECDHDAAFFMRLHTHTQSSLWRHEKPAIRRLPSAPRCRSRSPASKDQPAVAIDLAHGTDRERQAKVLLEQLFGSYDLSRYTFTRRVVIEERAINPPFQVLTLLR